MATLAPASRGVRAARAARGAGPGALPVSTFVFVRLTRDPRIRVLRRQATDRDLQRALRRRRKAVWPRPCVPRNRRRVHEPCSTICRLRPAGRLPDWSPRSEQKPSSPSDRSGDSPSWDESTPVRIEGKYRPVASRWPFDRRQSPGMSDPCRLGTSPKHLRASSDCRSIGDPGAFLLPRAEPRQVDPRERRHTRHSIEPSWNQDARRRTSPQAARVARLCACQRGTPGAEVVPRVAQATGFNISQYGEGSLEKGVHRDGTPCAYRCPGRCTAHRRWRGGGACGRGKRMAGVRCWLRGGGAPGRWR